MDYYSIVSIHSEPTQRLHQAIIDRDIDAVKQAIQDGADVNAYRDDGYNILAFLDHVEILKVCLAAGVDPTRAPEGMTPNVLYWACNSHGAEIVRLLLQAGCSVRAEIPDTQDRENWPEPLGWDTPLHAAVERGDQEIVRLLLEADGRCAFDVFDDLSRTPLMIAVKRGDIDMARLLIEAGSDVNAHDEPRIGDPALKTAVEGQGLEMIQLLLDAGADARITGWMNCSALDRARSRQGPLGPKIVKMCEESITEGRATRKPKP